MHVRPNVVTSTLQYGLRGIQNVAFWYNISRITILLIFQRFTVLVTLDILFSMFQIIWEESFCKISAL